MRTRPFAVGLLSLSTLVACDSLEGEKEIKFAYAMQTHGRDRTCTVERGEKKLTDIDAFNEFKDNIKSVHVVKVQAKITNDNTSGDSAAKVANGVAWLVSGANANIQVTEGDSGPEPV